MSQLLIEGAWNYTHINTSATFTPIVAVGAGVDPEGIFGGVEVNAPGTTWTISVYDGAVSGANLICAISAAAGVSYRRSTRLKNGSLNVVTAGTAGDCTILWK